MALGLGSLAFHAYLYLPLLHEKEEWKEEKEPHRPGISILLYTRNQIESLSNCLSTILTQDYPTFQVIVIDDGSTDGTFEWIHQQQLEHPQLHYTCIPESTRFKEHRALAYLIGAKAALHDILLFTEADCYPLSDQWLNTWANRYRDPHTEVVIGYCRYPKGKELLQQRMAFDNLRHGVRLLAAACLGHPYAGDGRNLSYRKTLLFRQEASFLSQWTEQADAQSSLVRQIAHAGNTKILCSPESQTETEPIQDLRTWKEICRTHFSNRRPWRNLLPTLYGFEKADLWLFHLAVFGTCLLSLPTHWVYALGALLLCLLRLVGHLLWQKKLARHLGQALCIRKLPLWEWL